MGYVGLAVSFYYLDDEGFVRTGILTGFLMILQNLLAVFILQLYAGHTQLERNFRAVLWKVVGNPMLDQVNVEKLETL